MPVPIQTPKKRQSFTILIADDDVDDQELMKRGLNECRIDIKIVSVYDGIRVLDYLNGKHGDQKVEALPDLLLLDLNMPLMDGFQVLKEIRRHPRLLKLPIYVITTSRNTDEWNKALDLGANGFYTKGSRSADIITIMRQVCKECFESNETDLQDAAE